MSISTDLLSLTWMTPPRMIGLELSQRLLAFECVHVGYYLLPVCSTTPSFRNCFPWQIRPPLCSAHPYGIPTILSSYSNFYYSDAGAPNGGTAHLPNLSSHIDFPGFDSSRHRELLGHRGCSEMVNANPLLQAETTAITGTMMCRFCQHRWPAIAGMVGFRNNVGSAALTGWVSPSSQQIAFARGTYRHLSHKGRAHA